jgi:hypothetical protein
MRVIFLMARDIRGLEGLPLKLLISVTIITLSIQPLYGAISYLGYSQNLGYALHEAEAIKRAALSAFVGGPGNVRKVAVSLSHGSVSFSIRLGGCEGEGRTRTIDVLWNGAVAATITLEGLGLSIICREGSEIVIEGSQELLLSCSAGQDRDVVIAEIS